MKHTVFRGFRIIGIAAIGSILTLAILMAFQLLTFQSPFYKAYQSFNWVYSHYLTPIPEEQLVDGAIQGMLATLQDPYSTYIRANADEAADHRETALGEIEGIGADIRAEGGHIVVISPVEGSPAAKAGLLPNDILLAADDYRLEGLSVEEAAKYIRGPKGSELSLQVRRNGLQHDFTLTMIRDTIPTETVTVKTLPNNIAVIRISEFAGTTGQQFDEVMANLRTEEISGLILDLRMNPGGLFHEGIAVSSHFVPEGELIALQANREGEMERFVSNRPSTVDIPAAVLVDEGTASTAEVVAGALRESAGLPLIGSQTFGKGVGQTAHFFPDGSMMKYTDVEMLNPKGTHFHHIGLTPDIEVTLPDYATLPHLQLTETYGNGDQGQEIRILQQYLEALGYEPGRTDGVFDAVTADAVAKFQEDQAIEVNGLLDADTVLAMSDQLKRQIQENDTQLDKAIDVILNTLR
ncbi:PDZ domain-containing protein [Xylanibacillus composti]|uniref:Carboxy-terminal processing protease CtpA n=1 Tax=Xylanibacillus composti TaxID=1572762 RepID=A0A8J4H1N0_9BACL|nr:S41 family peptidase [Xylanibacillus composti]MDT9723903.1 PDZ domain-containing protein [Xylanibacillus composti]GIQ67781.1 carboxy-terminal processing protease CtpA [Xylanibacillus composti]